MSLLRYALVTVPAVVLLGTLSGRLSNSGYGNPWFDGLVKPDFMPPGWAFGLAWTILYVLLGLSLAMLLYARGAKGRGRVIALFLLQLALNYAWSPVFFGLHKIATALSLIAAMIVVTTALLPLIWRIRPVAAALILPYLGWLVFAAMLTFEIDRLNPNAETLVPAAMSTDIAV